MLDQLPILALENIIKYLDTESRANLVKSAQQNESLNSKLRIFELASQCPFCILSRHLTPDRVKIWRNKTKFSEDQLEEIEHKILNFVLCNDVKVVDENCWARIVPIDEIYGYWLDVNSDVQIRTYEELTSCGLLVDFFKSLAQTTTHDFYDNFENHIFHHFSQCKDSLIGPIESKEKMYSVISSLYLDEHPFVVPEYYDTNLEEDLLDFLIRIVAAKYLASAPEFSIGLDQSEYNSDLTKYLLDQAYHLCLNIRLLSKPDIDMKYFVNTIRLLRLIFH